MSEWISIKERKPIELEYVLLWNGFWRGVGLRDERDGECPYPYQDEASEWIDPPPTHWMSLPDPPVT